jgi:hypothetical protein
MQGVITIAAAGTYSSGGCSNGDAVKKLTLVSGTLTYECGSTGDSGTSDLSVKKETSSSEFSSSEVCASGDAVKGLKFNDSGELSFLCASVGSSSGKGEKGEKGEKGDTGAAGTTGAKGDTGAQGIQGIQGIQGLKGDTGLTGATGSVGPTGAAGINGTTPTISVNSSITSGTASVSVIKTSADYKFTFTLPAIPSGYQEMQICVKKSDATMYLQTSCSPAGQYTSYTVLVKP